jgi:hypothetical protein
LRPMHAFRQSVYDMATTSQAAAATPARDDVYAHPPNPYSEAALAAWRDQQ